MKNIFNCLFLKTTKNQKKILEKNQPQKFRKFRIKGCLCYCDMFHFFLFYSNFYLLWLRLTAYLFDLLYTNKFGVWSGNSFAAVLDPLFLTLFVVWNSGRFFTFWFNEWAFCQYYKYMKNVMESIFFRWNLSFFLSIYSFQTKFRSLCSTHIILNTMRVIHLLRSFVMVIAVWYLFCWSIHLFTDWLLTVCSSP